MQGDTRRERCGQNEAASGQNGGSGPGFRFHPRLYLENARRRWQCILILLSKTRGCTRLERFGAAGAAASAPPAHTMPSEAVTLRASRPGREGLPAGEPPSLNCWWGGRRQKGAAVSSGRRPQEAPLPPAVHGPRPTRRCLRRRAPGCRAAGRRAGCPGPQPAPQESRAQCPAEEGREQGCRRGAAGSTERRWAGQARGQSCGVRWVSAGLPWSTTIQPISRTALHPPSRSGRRGGRARRTGRPQKDPRCWPGGQAGQGEWGREGG